MTDIFGGAASLYNTSLPSTSLVFPTDLGNNPSISFYFNKYELSSVLSKPVAIPTGTPITLPYPMQLTDDVSVSYNDSAEMGPIIGAAVSAAEVRTVLVLL